MHLALAAARVLRARASARPSKPSSLSSGIRAIHCSSTVRNFSKSTSPGSREIQSVPTRPGAAGGRFTRAAVPAWDVRPRDGRSSPASPRGASACRHRESRVAPGEPAARGSNRAGAAPRMGNPLESPTRETAPSWTFSRRSRCGTEREDGSRGGGDRISYEALDSRANAVAAELRRAGVSKGDRVPLLLPRGVQFIVCALGVMKCGAAYVPLDPSYPPERLRRMLEGLEARIGLARTGPVASAQTAQSSGWMPVWRTSCHRSRAQPQQVGARIRHMSCLPPARPADPKASRSHTEPSCGSSSGRILPAWDPQRRGCTWRQPHSTPRRSRSGPHFFTEAAASYLMRRFRLRDYCDEVIRRENVTSAWITSSLFNTIVDEAPACLSGLAQILIGGEVLSPSHVRRALDHLPGVRLVNGYGPTENTTFTCCHVISRADVDAGHTIPIGRPIANTTVHVLDADGRPAPVGVPGELVAGGDGVALGYVGQPEKTKHELPPRPILRTARCPALPLRRPRPVATGWLA